MKREHAYDALPYHLHPLILALTEIAFIDIAMTTKKTFDVLLPQATSNAFLFPAHVSRRENHRLMYFNLLMRTNVQGPNHKHSRSVRWASKKRHTSLVCFQSDVWHQCVCVCAPLSPSKNKTDCRRGRSINEEFRSPCSKARTTNLRINIPFMLRDEFAHVNCYLRAPPVAIVFRPIP